MAKFVETALSVMHSSKEFGSEQKDVRFMGVGMLYLACCVETDKTLLLDDIRDGMETIFGSCASLPLDYFADCAISKAILRNRMKVLVRRCPDFLTPLTLERLKAHTL